MDNSTLKTWLRTRLVSDRAAEEWRALLASAWTTFLDAPLAQLFHAQPIEHAIVASLDPEILAAAARPLVRGVVTRLIEDLRQDQTPIGRFVPTDARDVILRIVGRKGFLHEDWLGALFREEAVEAVVSDTLYRSLRDFSTLIPRLLSSLPGPIGRIAGIGNRVLEDVQKRLEGEIRRFVDAGTRRALDGALRFAVDHIDDPASIKLRTNVVDFMLSKEGAFHVYGLDNVAIDDIETIVDSVARHIACMEETRAGLKSWVDSIHARYGARPLRDLIHDLGGDLEPPLAVWADATWPVVASFLKTPAVEAWLDGLVDEMAGLLPD